MKTIRIVCVNDYPELAFLPNTSDRIIQQEKEKIEDEYKKRCEKDNCMPYIHIHIIDDVELFEG